jgi:alpha-tubulin suppressor-like RCC1 family protein
MFRFPHGISTCIIVASLVGCYEIRGGRADGGADTNTATVIGDAFESDRSVVEAGTLDASRLDVPPSEESGAADTGAADTGAADTGAADTGAADTGAADTGAADVRDAGMADAEPVLDAADAGADSPSLDAPAVTETGLFDARSDETSSPTDLGVCPPEQSRCGAACVNLTDDEANCGLCGQRCAVGQLCIAAQCIGDLPTPPTIAFGNGSVCAVTSNALVKCWGSNYRGQGAHGLTGSTERPTLVSGVSGAVGVVSTATSGSTCAWTRDGAVRCWGGYMSLGDGSTADRGAAGVVPGLDDVIALASGDTHFCALRGNGSVWCWGGNDVGQTGVQPTSTMIVGRPTEVSGLAPVRHLAAGSRTTCAVLRNQETWCWGARDSNYFVDGIVGGMSAPVRTGMPGSIVELSFGGGGICARHADGTAWTWGGVPSGNGPFDPTYLAPQQLAGVSGVVQISCGQATCVRLRSGAVQCWGDNRTGTLGDGSTVDRIRPVEVPGPPAREVAVSIYGEMCTVGNDSNLRCTGGASETLNPAMGIAFIRLPTPVPMLTDVRGVALGATSACALRGDGSVWCWGRNTSGELGDDSELVRYQPGPVRGLPTSVGLTAGVEHFCAWTAGGEAWCWGRGGDGTTAIRRRPVRVAGLSAVTQMSAWRSSTCALVSDGTVRCWGTNSSGQLGNGSTVDSPVPVAVSGLDRVVEIHHGCARRSDGDVRCWGGLAGDGTTVVRTTPVALPGVSTARWIRRGFVGLSNGSVLAWNSMQRSPSPITLPINAIDPSVPIEESNGAWCARSPGGGAVCWGDNAYGQLGDGTQVSSSIPVAVRNVDGVVRVAGGMYSVGCAIRNDQTLVCWGDGR